MSLSRFFCISLSSFSNWFAASFSAFSFALRSLGVNVSSDSSSSSVSDTSSPDAVPLPGINVPGPSSGPSSGKSFCSCSSTNLLSNSYTCSANSILSLVDLIRSIFLRSIKSYILFNPGKAFSSLLGLAILII